MGNRILKCLISCMRNAIFRYQIVIYSTYKVKIEYITQILQKYATF